MDGSHIEADFSRTGAPGAKVVSGSSVDSHGNQLPNSWDEIGDSAGRDYDFGGPGNSDDQRRFEQTLRLFQVTLSGRGARVHCDHAVKHGIDCRRSAR